MWYLLIGICQWIQLDETQEIMRDEKEKEMTTKSEDSYYDMTDEEEDDQWQNYYWWFLIKETLNNVAEVPEIFKELVQSENFMPFLKKLRRNKISFENLNYNWKMSAYRKQFEETEEKFVDDVYQLAEEVEITARKKHIICLILCLKNRDLYDALMQSDESDEDEDEEMDADSNG